MNRVPELIDVWFDSGSMPYGQWHYPFENQEIFKKQFPADFICEAVDQTRGWFYSLHAISTLLMDSEAYKNVVCLGLVVDRNGQKMSKSRGNAVNPWDVLKVNGADAFRWYFYTSGPPNTERRFSPDLVTDVVRNFTLTLWNVYSFFVTYANLDGWTPPASGGKGSGREGGTGMVGERSDLDHWILSELHTLVRDITTAFETYDVPGATRPIQTFIDLLSKWYLRRSRRRFWRSGTDADKQAAYATLYEALVTIAKLLAPTMPFLAEELYQNLVVAVDPKAPESVHLADWPMFDPTQIDETLNHNMEMIMKLASLGHAARKQAEIKVRQPLAEAAFAVANSDEAKALHEYAELLADELNVKMVRALGSAGEAVAYTLNPLPKQLGQKYKAKLPALRAALLALDPEPAAKTFLEGKPVTVKVEGESYAILPEEVEVRVHAREGLTVASEGAYLCALKTELTSELVAEGLAREFVRRVQDLRKQADFDIADRIRLYVRATPKLTEALQAYRDYVMGETLTVEMTGGAPPAEAVLSEAEFDEEKVTIGVVKSGT